MGNRRTRFRVGSVVAILYECIILFPQKEKGHAVTGYKRDAKEVANLAPVFASVSRPIDRGGEPFYRSSGLAATASVYKVGVSQGVCALADKNPSTPVFSFGLISLFDSPLRAALENAVYHLRASTQPFAYSPT